MKIFALDLGTRCGWACGAPGTVPVSGNAVLRHHAADTRGKVFANLLAWLLLEWRENSPSLIAVEAPLSLPGFAHYNNALATVELTYGLHAIVEAVAERFFIPFTTAPVASVRKHFLGRSRFDDRRETKRAVVRRCQLLGYMPADCHDDNRADALALWDYVAARHGGARPTELRMFGEAGR